MNLRIIFPKEQLLQEAETGWHPYNEVEFLIYTYDTPPMPQHKLEEIGSWILHSFTIEGVQETYIQLNHYIQNAYTRLEDKRLTVSFFMSYHHLPHTERK